jgi:regulatory protein
VVWARKFDSPPNDAAERARQVRFMMNRGFSSDTIRRLLRGEGSAAAELEEE